MLFSKGDSDKGVQATKEIVELTDCLHLLNSEIEAFEQEVSSIKQTIMTQMGEAETLTYQGKTLATWKAPKSSFRLDSKRLEAEEPTLYERYKTPIQNSRRLVIKHIHP